MAEDLGYLLAKNGFKVMCGGHGGIVTPLVSGATRGGGEVMGVSLAESKYPKRQAEMNPGLTETVYANTLAERLALFVDADGYIFFTGGIGSLAEFTFIWHSLQVAGDFARPIMFISNHWKRVLAEIKQEQMIKYKYYQQLYVCDRAKDAVALLTNDYSITYEEPGNIFFKDSVLFDLDGAVVESPEEEFVKSCENIGYFFHMPDVITSVAKARRRQGVPERKAKTQDEIFAYNMNILGYLGIDTPSATEIARYLCKVNKRIPDLYDDAADILHYFKENGFSTGIMSSRDPFQVEETLSAHRLSSLIDFVIGAPEDTTRVDEALEPSGLRKDSMIFIGDNFQKDYLNPRTSEVDAILLDRHLTHILNDEAPKIRSLRELRHLIKRRAD